MTEFVAHLGLLAMSVALQLANYWFTFGLWPQSWTSFTLCSTAYALLVAVRIGIDKDKKK